MKILRIQNNAQFIIWFTLPILCTCKNMQESMWDDCDHKHCRQEPGSERQDIVDLSIGDNVM